jgi:hypothetical protein
MRGVGGDYWVFSIPGPLDQIEWTSGGNFTDGAFHPLDQFGPEPKFNVAIPPPQGRQFAGFQDADGPGPQGSFALTRGLGHSGKKVILGWTVYYAKWKIEATGQLGPGNNPSWESRCGAYDPYSITPEKLAETGADADPVYDLFFTAALDSGSYSPLGGVSLEAFYDDASGTTALMSITVDSTGVNVVNDDPPGLTLYLLDSLCEGPTENPGNVVTLNDIQTMLNADVASDRTIDTPLYIGFVWDDVPVPTVDLGDGSVARIRVESEAYDADAGLADIPTLTEWGLIAFAVTLLALGTWMTIRRRTRAAVQIR